MIRYDTVYLHVRKSWWDGQPNLVHGTEMKNKEKNFKNEYLRKNGPGSIPWRQSGKKKWNFTGVGFVKRLVLSREWKREGVIEVQSGESKEEEVMDEGIGEQEMVELVPE